MKHDIVKLKYIILTTVFYGRYQIKITYHLKILNGHYIDLIKFLRASYYF